jgi:glycosyltransferase involved in cell wall biosynthesis
MDVLFDSTVKILERKGVEVLCLTRDSRIRGIGFSGKFRAFTSGFYSSSAYRELRELIRNNSPDLVHVHEIFPFISPWIFNLCRHLGVPVIMRCANCRLICPTAHMTYKGCPCELCVGGREYWCVLKNCRDSLFESVAYAARNLMARKAQLYKKNVTLFEPPSEFIKHWLINDGILEDRIIVIPNMVSVPESTVDMCLGKYVAYAGRFSPEKGIEILLAAAQKTGLPLRLAGDYSTMPEIIKRAPPDAEFTGHLNQTELFEFYRNARFLIVPSTAFESFGIVAVEAMSHGLPVIASKLGGLLEIVDDGVTGFLFEPGNSEDLAVKMKLLWDAPDLCWQMGQAGREKVVREYNEDTYYNRIMACYEKAIDICKLR